MFENYLDKRIYTLRVIEVGLGNPGKHKYCIYPAELCVQEVRLGRALNDVSHDSYYGPGSVTLLCKNNRGHEQAFSPLKNELISNRSVAGRNCRGFFDKDKLKSEAEILKGCVFCTYKNVSEVEISFPEGFFNTKDKSYNLVEQIQSASIRAAEPQFPNKTQAKKPAVER